MGEPCFWPIGSGWLADDDAELGKMKPCLTGNMAFNIIIPVKIGLGNVWKKKVLTNFNKFIICQTFFLLP